MILIVAKIRVRSEYADAFPSLMEPFTQATRAEPGNLGFDWSRDVTDPSLYVLVEAFRDGDAGAAHVNSEHFKAAIDRMADVIAERPEIVNVDVPDGWARMAEVQFDD